MATLAENLATSIAQVGERIVEVTASANPDYTVGGRTISKGTYLTQLVAQLELLKQAQQRAGGPFVVTSRGVP